MTKDTSKASQIVINSFCAIVGAVVGGLVLYAITETNIPRIQQTQTVGGDSIASPQLMKLSKYGMGTGDDSQPDRQVSLYHDLSRFSATFEAAFAVDPSSSEKVSIPFERYRELLKSKRQLDEHLKALEPYFTQLAKARSDMARERGASRRSDITPASKPN